MSERDSLVRAALDGAVRSGVRGWVIASCPFCAHRHQNARRKCFGILAEHGVYRCFRCGVKGRLDGYTSQIERAPMPTLREVSFAPPEGYTPLWDDRSISLAPAREYLNKRGLPLEVIQEAQIGACAYGYYAGRVIAPILDVDRITWLGFAARSWLPKSEGVEPYLYPSGMLKGQLFYNMPALYNENAQFLVAVEGSFDALALMRDMNVVAFLGKPSSTQEDMLVDCPLPVVCLLDGDAFAESNALMWRLKMRGKHAIFIKLPPGEDPASLGVDWVLHALSRYF